MKVTRKRNWMKCVVASVLAFVLTFADVLPAAVMTVQAAEATITSMAYTEGPVITREGMGSASFGFIMPTFNGGANTYAEVASDLSVKVKVNGNYEDIDDHKDKYTYNSNWGNWSDGGFNGYWFTLTETTYIQLYSKSNPGVALEYTLLFNTTDSSDVTALNPTSSISVKADRSGSAFIGFPTAVSASGSYPTGAAVLDIFIKPLGADDSEYVNIDNNPASGWIWDNNFGLDQNGYGYWFNIAEKGDVNVKLALKEKETVFCVFEITYEPLVRDNYKLYPQAETTATADAKTGAAGMVFPRIGGNTDDYLPGKEDLDKFVIEFYKEDTGTWVPLGDSAESDWYFQGNGYVDYSSKNQWGYFFDYVYGLWFQPIQQDFKMRVGYPLDGVVGGDIGDNYIEYTFIGAPGAHRPDDILLENIEIDETDKAVTSSNELQLDGWTMVFHDEFNGTELNEDYWTREAGYFSDPSNPDTWGWGNSELESYTESVENSWVSDGALHLKAFKGETDWPFDTNGDKITDRVVTSTYKSGKVVSKDKVKFTYGRVDFRAKLPAGVGLWPATWMMPNDNYYGAWACSGEIDVMEVRGRVPNESTGAIHFGSTWPDNRHASPSKYTFPEGTGVDDGYHTYSVIWEEDYIAWYVDGNFFQYVPSSSWYTVSSPSETAPFDKPFYLIMNLALGGWFDDQVTNDMVNIDTAEMLVDFVRVYQITGEENCDFSIPVDIEDLALSETEVTLTEGESVTLSPIFTPTNTTEKGLTWTTTDANVATVNNGKVTAIKEGTATITATSTKNPELKATVTVKVEKAPEVALEGLSLSKTEVTLTEGDNTTLTVTYKPSNTTFKDVTWKSSKESVATVVDGKITAVAEGEAVITVTSATNAEISASCTVTVEKKQQEPVIPSEDYGVTKNADGSLTFWVNAEANKADNMLYYGKNIVEPTLNKLGGYGLTADAENANYYTSTISGPFADTDTISFMFGYYPIGSVGKTDSAITTLTYGDIAGGTSGGDEDEEVALTGLTLSQTSVTLSEGENTTLTVNYTPSTTTQKDVTWKSSNEAVATVVNGVVTAVAEGEAVITVTSTSNADISASCTVTVEKEDEEPVIPSSDYGVTKNADGSLTFWVNAEANKADNMLYYGKNIVEPTLNKLGGYGLTADAENANYYTSTISGPFADTDTISFMFGYYPIGSVGKTDSAITTLTYGDIAGGTSGGDEDEEVALTGLTLSQTSATLTEGENTTLTVSYTPSTTTQKDVTWKSSNEAVATVVNGVVTAVGKGTATITVTSAENSGISATCAVTVNAKDAGGDDPVVPSDVYGAYQNEDGSVTVWVYSEDRNPVITYYVLNNTSPELSDTKGAIMSLDASKGENYYSVTISDLDYEDGDTFTYLVGYKPVGGAGNADSPYTTITLTKESSVDPEVEVTALALNPANVTLTEGENTTLTVNYTPSTTTQKDVTWKSSNEAVATVVNGVVTAVGKGTATITVASVDKPSVTATCTVTVEAKEVALTGLTLSPTSKTLKEGENTSLTVGYAPSNTTQTGVTWSTSDANVATVVNGVVTAVGKGTATITVASTSNASIKATCTITVEAVEQVIAITGLALDKTSATLTEGENATLIVSYTPSNTTQTGVTWKSSNEAVATVVSGVVTAVGKGTATITAISTNNANVKATCEITVEAEEPAPIENPFGDVNEGDWFYPYVMFAYKYGFMGGKGTMPDGSLKFDPSNSITRAEFVTMLYAKENRPAVEYVETFTDVPAGQWYTDAILWAAREEIVGGKKVDYFDVNGKITRQEIALILYKYALYKEYDVSETENADLTGFADVASVSTWAETGMKWAVEYNVIGGKNVNGETLLSPGGNAIRAEAATMLKAFMGAFEGITE